MAKAADLGVGDAAPVATVVPDPDVVDAPVADERTFKDVTTPASECLAKSDSATSRFTGTVSE